MPYVPIMQTKAGELKALELINNTIKPNLLPCLELQTDVLGKWDDSNLQDKSEKWAKKLKKAWPLSQRCLLDLNILDGSPWLAYVLQALLQHGPVFTPVVRPSSSSSFHQAIAAHTANGRGLCLRLGMNSVHMQNDIGAMLSMHSAISLCDVDLIIDYGVHSSLPLGIAPTLAAAIAALQNLADYRVVAFAATTFPTNMGIFQTGISQNPRGEWLMWKAIQSTQVPRAIAFGDYTAAPPSDLAFDPITMKMGAKIKYTADDYWLIVKGRAIKNNGFGQYHDLSAQLVARPEYCGSGFSWGDAYIYNCAQGGATGNAQNWVTVAVNHHIAFVTGQLASLNAL